MTTKKIVKIIVDLLMYCDFIFLMSHDTVRDLSLHAWAGIGLFVLLIIHNFLNIWFYKNTIKGKYNFQRILLSVTAWILLVLMILMAVSSVYASGAVFEWSPFIFTQKSRTLHLMSTSWGYMVMSFHLALHINSALTRLDKKILAKTGNTAGIILLVVLYLTITVLGSWAFMETQLWYFLFNTGNWKMAAYELWISFAEYAGITAAICGAYHLICLIIFTIKKLRFDTK